MFQQDQTRKCKFQLLRTLNMPGAACPVCTHGLYAGSCLFRMKDILGVKGIWHIPWTCHLPPWGWVFLLSVSCSETAIALPGHLALLGCLVALIPAGKAMRSFLLDLSLLTWVEKAVWQRRRVPCLQQTCPHLNPGHASHGTAASLASP